VANLTITIAAELTQIRRALQTVSGDITKLRGEAAKASPVGLTKNVEALRTQLGGAVSAVRGLVSAWASFATLKSLGTMADEAATLGARLKLATKSQEELTTATEGTFDIAQRTRTSLQSTVELYGRLERSTRDLKLNQATLLQLTESINQAAQISGGGQAAEAALIQLSQGLASGVLRGEELNSVMEQTPRLAQAIADGLDVPIGKLRQMGQDGKISVTDIAKAILSQRQVLADEFAQFPTTIGGAFTALRNAIVKYVGEADKASGASAKLVEAIKLIAQNLPAIVSAVVGLAKVWGAYWVTFRLAPAVYAATAAAAAAYARAQAAVAASLEATATAALQLRVLLLSIGGILVAAVAGWQIGKFLREQFIEVEIAGIAMVEGLLVAWERIKQAAEIAAVAIKAAFVGAFNGLREIAASFYGAIADGAAKLPEAIGGGLAASMRALQQELLPTSSAADQFAADVDGITKSTEANIAAIKEITGEMVDYAAARRLANTEDKKAKGQVGVTTKPIQDPKVALARAVAAAELAKDAISRALDALKIKYDDNLVSLKNYYEERARLETEAINQEIARQKAELAAATKQEDRIKILTKITELERDRAEVGPRAAREQARAERDLADELRGVQARLLELQGQTAEARTLQLQQEFRDLRQRLITENDRAGVELVDKLINVEAARAKLDELKTQISNTLNDLRSNESNISAQTDAGLLGTISAETQLTELRKQSLAQLVELRAAVKALYDQTKDPEVLRALTQLDAEIARVAASTELWKKQLKEGAESSFSTFFQDIVSGAKTAGDALRQLAIDFAKMIAEIAAKRLSAQITDSLFSFLGLGGGGIGAVIKHAGGPAGSGIRRMVSPALFAAAPRYHSGGVAGLRPGEVPAILQQGEQVVPADQAQQRQGFRVVNVVDPRLAGDYLESADGERVIMNIIGRNPGQVRQLLGTT
jgi:tape measure domain-containing protein